MKELIKIQSKLKAPKSQFNAFGKYKYRSQEDILEAVKPLLKENDCYLNLSDDIVNIRDRFYVHASATIKNSEGESVSSSGWAREPVNKKGMDVSQITGAASSYARKYALNGLFAIDDTKDSDVTNTHDSKKTKKGGPSEKQKKFITKLVRETGVDMKKLKKELNFTKINNGAIASKVIEYLLELKESVDTDKIANDVIEGLK